MNNEKIKEMLDKLTAINESLLSLPDDMLLSIDPRDNVSLYNGLTFIKEFNDNLSVFSASSSKIEQQMKKYFSINNEDAVFLSNISSNTHIFKNEKSYSLSDDFTYTRPYGFILQNVVCKGFKTWKGLYIHILKELKKKNATIFLNLPDDPKFISKRGNPLFSRSKKGLRVAEQFDENIFIEINLSAKSIAKIISDLLPCFDIQICEMEIFILENNSD